MHDNYRKPHGNIDYIDQETNQMIVRETWNMGMLVDSVKYSVKFPQKIIKAEKNYIDNDTSFTIVSYFRSNE